MPEKPELGMAHGHQTPESDSDDCPNNEAPHTARDLLLALPALKEFLQQLAHKLEAIYETITPYVKAIEPHFTEFVRYSGFIDAVNATGWLPYHTISINVAEECEGDVALLERQLSKFYESNWSSIRQDIESRIEQYHISEESKATFREALAAHDLRLYRCVCRVLFPEIDRELRRHFFDDRAGSISSKEMLEKLTNQGSLGDFMPREAYGWILFGRLVKHLYEQINDENRAQFEKDDIPNRHASIHGLVHYTTQKHSVNMIIMADYVFQILTSLANLPPPEQ